jgi:anti-sigma B factor antagonist
MITKLEGNTLRVGAITELNATNAANFRDDIRTALTDTVNTLDVDFSATTFVDSSGLGALIALHKTMATRGGCVRILNPAPTVRQILELTRLHRVFEIVNP